MTWPGGDGFKIQEGISGTSIPLLIAVRVPPSPMLKMESVPLSPSIAVKVALESQSGVSTQLKAALAAELVDYLVQTNWSPKPQAEVKPHLFFFPHMK